MTIKPVQNQFNGGEISPYMDGRFDLPAYQYAAAIMRNFIPISEGCMKRRGGTHYVASVKTFDAFIFKINATPEDAAIVIDNVPQKQCWCAKGDMVNYIVSAEGYQSQSGTYKITDNAELAVVLVSNTVRYNVVINAQPADAVVVINGLKRNNITAALNSKVAWSVSKDGYRTQEGVIEHITQDVTITVDLKMRLTINAKPDNAKVVMNGVEQHYIDVDPGSEVEWTVSAEGYQSQSGRQTVNKTQELVINLSSQVVGETMFESSTPGEYNLKLSAGLYELLMCGAGGGGYSQGIGLNSVAYMWNGGSAAVFQGILKLAGGDYSIQVGKPVVDYGGTSSPDVAASKFSQYITCGAGYGSVGGNKIGNKGGVLEIADTSAVKSSIIAANGADGVFEYSSGDPGIVYAPLPAEYKNSYGFGGKARTSGRGNLGGDAYVKLVYKGEDNG